MELLDAIQGLKPGDGDKNNESCVQFVCENEKELLAAIRNFGRYQLTNLNLALQDVYLQNEDYIKPSDDHDTLFKGLNQCTEPNLLEDDDESKESIV
ncbi:hypothetical protein EVAR_72643_1 [Eumeta japonica]|uniref:Uncharacterized protein n=1 Tax=Eumeta variegata TaxID=151549 RepID=A0A4C1TGA6_EUMVA|nr:hypothetical protein EVAR_72643_1 [Eumeta japonica]